MPQGLECYRADGSLEFRADHRLGRIIKIITAYGGGSHTVTESYSGTLFAFASDGLNSRVWISGNTVSWTFWNYSNSNIYTEIFIGVL